MLALLAAASAAKGDRLPEVIDEAQRSNPELRVLESSVGASKGGVITARTRANPELSFAPGVRRTSESGIGSKDDFHGDFALSQLFEWPGKRALKIALAQEDVTVQQLAVEAFRFEIAAKVRRAFYELLAAQKITTLRQEQVESSQTFVESSRKRAESGYASDFETLKSQAELIAAQRELLDAQGKVAAARVTLNSLLGRLPSASLEVEGTLEGAGVRSAANASYVALAMARNPSLRTLNVQAESAGLNLRATRFGRRPDFAVGPQVEYTHNEQIYGLGVTVALPFWDRKKGEIQTATAEQQKTLAEIEKTRREIEAAVTTASKNLELAQKVRALYTPEFLRKLKALVSQAEQSYAQNATTLIIYLDAKRTYFDALSSYYDSLGNVAGQRAELESAIGVPLDTNP
ncbi:MAG: TolC family protein [Chthoniobacterales bacterium]|nr:TolC family protein [Chthoniobacterales bacterium]